MLVSKIIDLALIELGVKNPTDEANSQEVGFALDLFNVMMDTLNSEGLLFTYLRTISYNEPASGWSRVITIGDGEDIDTTDIPNDIYDLYFKYSGVDYYLKNVSRDEIDKIAYKSLSGIPTVYNYQFVEDNKLEIRFDYIPLTGMVLYLVGVYPFKGSDTNGGFKLTDNFSGGYGFEKLLINKLAVELAPSYGITPSQLTILKAREGLKLVKRRNYKPRLLESSYRKRTNIRDNLARY